MAGVYKKQLQKKLHEEMPEAAENQGGDDSSKDMAKKDPSHHSELDPKSMKITDLRHELEVRNLSSKGLKSQLIARLTKALKAEHEREEETDGKLDEDDDEDEKMDEEKEDCDLKKKEEEEKKKEEKERAVRERRYTLPETQSIIVHPSRTAKGGKFDCTVMSLSVLLDYRQEDNKEYSFEVSLFAELFNEMLMRDFGFRIYRALVEIPERKEIVDKDKDKGKKKDKDKRDLKKDEKEDGESKKDSQNQRRNKVDDDKEIDPADDMDDEDYPEDEMEDDEDDERKDKRKDERKHDKDKRLEKAKMYTADPSLLLASVYFDQNHCGYLLEKDLEEILYTLGLNISRAQVRKLLQNAILKENFIYRKLTDKPGIKEESDVDVNKDNSETTVPNVEELAAGNRALLAAGKNSSISGSKEAALNVSPPDVSGAGHVMFNGALLDIGKLLQQLQRSEKARTDVEDKLTSSQEELVEIKEIASSMEQTNQKLSSDLRDCKKKMKSAEDELKLNQDKVQKYVGVIKSCHELLQPTLSEDVMMVCEDAKNMKVEKLHLTYGDVEHQTNGSTSVVDTSNETTIIAKLEQEK